MTRQTNAERWSEQLESDGYVEFLRGGGAVGFIALFVLFPPVFAYLGWQGELMDAGSRSVGPVLSVMAAAVMFLLGAPVILEAVFSGRPALRVDGDGLQIAGWPRMRIGWDELIAADLSRSHWGGTPNSVLVTPGVLARHRERQFVLLRWVHAVNGARSGDELGLWRVYYPSTTEILKWLDTEISKRVEMPSAQHSYAWQARKVRGLVAERSARSEDSRSSRSSRRRKRRLRKKR